MATRRADRKSQPKPGARTDYERQYLLLVRESDRAAANERYAHIDPDTGGDKTFDGGALALPRNPTVTVARYCITRATVAMVQRFADRAQDLIDAGRLKVYRLDDGAWTVESALADARPGGLVPTVEA